MTFFYCLAHLPLGSLLLHYIYESSLFRLSSIFNILCPIYLLSLSAHIHLNLASLSFPLIYSFIILPILPSPQEIISIFHSATSSSASYAFVSVNTFVTNNKKT